MRRLLGVLAQRTAALGRGEHADQGLVRDVLRCLIDCPGRQHHPIEHLALWRLVRHGHVARAVADELDFELRAVRHFGGQLLRLLQGGNGDLRAPRGGTQALCRRCWAHGQRRAAAGHVGTMPTA